MRIGQEMAPEIRQRLIGELANLAAQGQLPLDTGGTYPLDRSTGAMKAALEPGRGGKILLAA